MQLFYSPEIKTRDTIFVFDKDESKHITKVLRKQQGEELNITDGRGNLFSTEIIIASPKRCEVKVISYKKKEKRPFKLHIAIAPTKMNDRFEWFLEKSTEIGIEEITPVICDHSERKVIKLERMEKIVQSAMKQSLHCHKPKLNQIIDFKEFIALAHKGKKFIAHCEESDKMALKNVLTPNENCTILIGPEGDFSVKEIETALEHEFIPVTLGSSRLRTETAGIAACHTVALIND